MPPQQPTLGDFAGSWGTSVVCGNRGTCKASIPLGALVHKCKTGKNPTCFTCGKKYQVPKWASRDPKDYQRPGKKEKSDSAPSETEKALKKALSDLAATKKELNKKQGKQEAPSDGKPEAEGKKAPDLQKLRGLKASLDEAGQPVHQKLLDDLKKAETAAEKAKEAKAKPDLKTVTNRLAAAHNTAKQCAEQLLKLEGQVKAAREKGVDAELAVVDLQAQEKLLLAQKGFVPERTLPTLAPPENLSPELLANYRNFFQQFYNQQDQLFKAFEKQRAEWEATFVVKAKAAPMEQDGGPPSATGELEPTPSVAALTTYHEDSVAAIAAAQQQAATSPAQHAVEAAAKAEEAAKAEAAATRAKGEELLQARLKGLQDNTKEGEPGKAAEGASGAAQPASTRSLDAGNEPDKKIARLAEAVAIEDEDDV